MTGRLARGIGAVLRWSIVLGAGMVLGVTTAVLATRGEPPLGAVRSGPWTAWPGAGGPDADPYARAVRARDGRIPLSPAAGVRFLATTDSDGRGLDGRCTYVVAGPTPTAEGWTLTLLDRAGFPVARDTGRAGFTSAEVVRGGDGSFVVALAPQVQPGNWLPSPASGRFTLMLSLYDTPLGRALRMGGAAPALPAIARGPCG